LNRVVWDLRMGPAVAEPEGAAATPIAGGGFGGGRGGASTGPLVLPGKYHVTLKVPGSNRELKGEVAVEGDPLANFSEADRRARQAVMLSLYGLQKSLGNARTTAQALVAQMDSIKKDVTAGGSNDATKRADDLAAHLNQILTDINREFSAAGGLIRPIESFSGLPSADQMRQVDWSFEDATKTVNELNSVIRAEIPGLYAQFAKQPWPKPVQPLPSIRR
jgi:hypothetical protein